MALITLTSDFGLKDHHVASMKGIIYSEIDDVKIIDISHLISPFNLIETAYIVRNAIKTFPKGTINVISVDAERSDNKKLIIAEIDNQYLVTADNGIISILTEDYSSIKVYEITELDVRSNSSSKLLVKAACHIARGGTMSVIGTSINSFKELKSINPQLADNGSKIIGTVAYIDNYGNAITNITYDFFKLAMGDYNRFEIVARNHKWTKIFNRYNEIENNTPKISDRREGKDMVLFNTSNLLEIAIYKSNPSTVGGASTLLGLKYSDLITINLFKNDNKK